MLSSSRRPVDERLIPYHYFLVEAAETERRLPKAINLTLKTLWPETASERNIDYKPDRTVVTLCKATNKQVDAHSRALELVIKAIADPTDRRIVWAVAQSAAFRERGPKFKKLAHKFKGMGGSYPKGWRGLKSDMRKRYLASSTHISTHVPQSCLKKLGSQSRQNA